MRPNGAQRRPPFLWRTLPPASVDTSGLSEEDVYVKPEASNFEAILNATTESIFLVDVSGTLLAINEIAASRLNHSRIEMEGKCIFDFFPPEVSESRRNHFFEVAQCGVARYTEDQRGERHFSMNYYPIKGSQGRVEKIAVYATDITTRKLAETALRDSESRYRRFAEELPLGIVITQDGLIKYANLSVALMLGYQVKELLQKPFLPLVCEEDRPRLLDLHQGRMRGEEIPPNYDVGMIRKDGEVRQWSMHASTIEWDGKRCALGSCIDITERRLREQELKLTQQRLTFAQRAAAAGLWDWDLTTDTMYWSQEMCSLFGIDSGTAEVSLDTWRRSVHPEDLDRARGRTLDAIRSATALTNEYRIILPNGNVRWIAAYGNTTCDAQGKAVRMSGISVDVSERYRLETALRESDERFRMAFRVSPDAVNITRVTDGRYLEVSDGFVRMTGWTPEEAIGKTSTELGLWANVDDRQRIVQLLQRNGHFENEEICFRAKDGGRIEGLMSGRTMVIGEENCLLSVTRDISQRKQAERALQEAKELTDAIVENVPLMIFLKEASDLRFVLLNRAGEELTGLKREDLQGHDDRDFFPVEQAAEFMQKDREVLAARGGVIDIPEEPIQTVGMGERLLHTRKVAILGADGAAKYLLGISEDITQRKAAEDEIKNLAFYDPLTQLPNRRLLIDRLSKVLAASSRSGKIIALLFIDLDNFKTLNDNLGHHVGDILLQQVTVRLLASIRQGDTVARLGGDEFVVLLEELSNESLEAATQAEVVGRQILSALNQTYHLPKHDHHCTASVGITLHTDHSESIDELLKRADLAMYQAKAAGRNTLRFFDPTMQASVTHRASLEADMRDAVPKNQLRLCYQAQVSGNGLVRGVEVLLRWHHPERGLVEPLDFIGLAEDSGMILAIGNWVLEEACTQLARWAQIPELAQLTIAVNVSARQFHQADFVDQLRAVLERTGAEPQRLKLELTESLMVRDVEDLIAKMSCLKADGIGFSLDDFGTGYSSLQYLKRLPLDELKIDRSFVQDVLADQNDAAIAKMIIALARSMGLSVIAEGVELQAQADFLAREGCDAYQGYLFSRPLEREAFEAFARRS